MDFLLEKDKELIGNGKVLNEINPSNIKNIVDLVDIKNYWRNSDSIMQQSCFYPLAEIRKLGFLNDKSHFTMDYELWGNLLLSDLPIVRCDFNIGIFRWYEGQKTSHFNIVTNNLIKSAINLVLIEKQNSYSSKIYFNIKILTYAVSYYYHYFRSKIGIKRQLKSLFDGNSGNLYK